MATDIIARGIAAGVVSQVSADRQAVSEDRAAVETAKTEVLNVAESIPEDYSTLSADVSELKEDINNKANTSDVYTKTETDNKIISKVAEIVAGAPEDFDTLKEMSDWIASHENSAAEMNSAIQTLKTGMVSKVDTTSIPSLTQEEYDALTEKTALYYFIKE